MNSYGSKGAKRKENQDQANYNRKFANLEESDCAHKPVLTQISNSIRKSRGHWERDRSDGERLEATDRTSQS